MSSFLAQSQLDLTNYVVLACESTRPEFGCGTPTNHEDFHSSALRLGAKPVCKDVARQSAGVFTALKAKGTARSYQYALRPDLLCIGNHPLLLFTKPWYWKCRLVREAVVQSPLRTPRYFLPHGHTLPSLSRQYLLEISLLYFDDPFRLPVFPSCTFTRHCLPLV